MMQFAMGHHIFTEYAVVRGESFHVPVEVSTYFPEKGSTGVGIETGFHGAC
jgi:hypothetical protein